LGAIFDLHELPNKDRELFGIMYRVMNYLLAENKRIATELDRYKGGTQ
jgi:hypothetical protein